MEKSESIKNIAQALVKFQGMIGKIQKDSVNPFFKSKYAALPDILSAIQQPLIDCDLTLNQFPSGQFGLTTIIIHSVSGEYLMDSYIMKPVKDDPQQLGSSITYQRRYAIGAALSLNIDEDDDGNAASKTPPPAAADARPFLSEKAIKDAVARIEAGEEGIVDKITTAFQIKPEQLTILQNTKKLQTA